MAARPAFSAPTSKAARERAATARGAKDKQKGKPGTPSAKPSTGPDAPAARGAAKKREGDEAMRDKRFADALAAYEAAYTEQPDAALLYNRARAAELSERFPEALLLLEQFEAQAPAELRAKVPKLADLVERLRSKVATVGLTASVDGARVRVRGEEVGLTPLAARLRVATGAALVEVSKAGYVPFSREVTLPGGATTVIDARLERIVLTSVLVVRSPVSGTIVRIDGEPHGPPPVERDVTPGRHEVVVSREGYTAAQASVTVEEGARREIELSPAPGAAPKQGKPSGVSSSWWIWAGIGVAVAGGVALTAALLTEKSAGKGTIAPGQVAAGLSF